MRRTALRQRGANAGRWEAWQEEQASLVKLRAHHRCEVGRCGLRGEHVHHLFSRSHIIAEPMASSAAMCVYACFEHHRRLHRPDTDGALIDVARWQGIHRALCQWPTALIGLTNPVDAAREMERVHNPDLKMRVEIEAAKAGRGGAP